MQFVVLERTYIGDWKVAVRSAGLTYRDLASLTGVSLDAVKSYGAGRRRVPDAWLQQVSALLERRVEDVA